MALTSSIEWTDATWNPLTGCTKISEGCKNCYAEKLSIRLKAMKSLKYINGFQLSLHTESLSEPLSWKKPRNIFVNSMSDTFHEDVPDDFILKMFDIMNRAKEHQFQVLTKRSERMLKFNGIITWTDNIWLGVTVENDANIKRIDDLKKMKAKTKFISFEPLIGKISKIDLVGIDWVIVGGESGPNARTIEEEWVDYIYEQAELNNTPFFFKQWGGRNRRKTGRIYKGIEFNNYPKT